MVCLRCGYCCREIWPGNHNDELGVSEPCPNLIQSEGEIATCKIYSTRPIQCQKERMGAGDGEPCMIGMQALDEGKIPHPVGMCMNCGGLRFSDDNAPFCSESCADAALHEVMD